MVDGNDYASCFLRGEWAKEGRGWGTVRSGSTAQPSLRWSFAVLGSSTLAALTPCTSCK